MSTNIRELQRDVSGLKETVAVMAVAVDGHTHRLDEIEKRLGPITSFFVPRTARQQKGSCD
jgi:hypothetical protein